jgi:Zinc-finger domain of monoamine-oxidase A repressor R1
MNAYELEREARIRQNKERLAALVDTSLIPTAAAAASKTKTQKSTPSIVPPRPKSRRLLGKPARSYKEDPLESWERSVRGGGGGGQRGLYGVEGATTCHSCRQKTTSLKAECTACPLLWCKPCLNARYGEDAHTVNATGSWTCPKCRLCCICSACLRKAGSRPTGQMFAEAVKNGFTNVYGYLSSLN